MKNPTPAAISLLAAAIIALLLWPLGWILGWSGWRIIVGVLLAGGLSYAVVLFVVNYFVYRKVKLIYKTIYTVKSSKFNQQIQDKFSSDPLGEVMHEVGDWARDRGAEMEQELRMETYRKEFLGNVSHELKTPIFNIQGYIHSLLDGAMEDPELTRHFLKKAAKSADRMEMLVKDLLTISELESGSQKLDLETFDVYDVIKDILESLEFKALEKKITLGFKQGCTPPFFVRADKKKIRQVFVNLVTNSIKYGKDGGQTLIGLYDMDKNYLIEVSDNGIGIEEEHLPRLFERFYRVDKARSRDEGGTGLGLAIVKHIVEAHNQSVNVRSNPGDGSTFGVTLEKAIDKEKSPDFCGMKKLQFTDLVLFENDQVVVVNKPPMLSSLDERFAEAPSLLRMAKAYNEDLRLCHRLDKETSGALILAKDDESYRFVSMEFEHRRILKKYHAVVEGIHQFEMEEVDLPIGTGRSGLMRVDFGSGKEALTYFNSIQYFRHYTLVECTPITGRTHQIRVHLSARKAVIANDTAYGAKVPYLSQIKRKFNLAKFEEEKPMINRFALHARALKFRCAEDVEVEVTAPYPKDMEVFLKQLEKWDS